MCDVFLKAGSRENDQNGSWGQGTKVFCALERSLWNVLVVQNKTPHGILNGQAMWSDFCFGKRALVVFWLFIAELQTTPLWCSFEQPPLYYVFLFDQEYGQVSAGQLFGSTCLSLGNQLVAGLFLRVAHWFGCLDSASFPYGLSASPRGLSNRVVGLLVLRASRIRSL